MGRGFACRVLRRSRLLLGRVRCGRRCRCCSAMSSVRRRSASRRIRRRYGRCLARYFERMSGIVESHGGRVEKFIGDAVMAVFGVPADARGRCVAGLPGGGGDARCVAGLGIRGRIGVNTGEVVTGTAERLVTGDAVNVAARFEQAAAPGEVLIGEPTHALVHGAVVAEPVEPLELKGKSEPVPAFRLVSVLDAPERSHASRFVGRERELALIGGGVGARAGAVALRAGDGGGRSRGGQIAAGGGGTGSGRGSGRAGALPALRGGDHLLASRRGREAAGRAAVRSRCGGGDPLAPGRVGRRDERGRDRLGVPQTARGAGAAGRVSSTTSSGATRPSST